jgi:hypothetical protein
MRDGRLPYTARPGDKLAGFIFAYPINNLQAFLNSRHLVPRTRLLPCNREPERTHDVSGRCPLSSRDHGGISLKQWAAGAPVIGAAPVGPVAQTHGYLIGGQVDQRGCVPRHGRPKRPRVEGLPASGALQLFCSAGGRIQRRMPAGVHRASKKELRKAN